MTFSVDGVVCPDTSGVGVNGEGGLFNCGLQGETFKLECTSACTTELAIVELKLWKTRTLNLHGTPSIMSGNAYYQDLWTDSDLLKVFGTGSLWMTAGQSWWHVLAITKGTASRVSL